MRYSTWRTLFEEVFAIAEYVLVFSTKIVLLARIRKSQPFQ